MASSMRVFQELKLLFTPVEQLLFKQSGVEHISASIPYLVVDNIPKLGLLASLRFLEWVSENPEGVISLPTGKTPEFFIKWSKYLLENWDTATGKRFLDQHGMSRFKKPSLTYAKPFRNLAINWRWLICTMTIFAR